MDKKYCENFKNLNIELIGIKSTKRYSINKALTMGDNKKIIKINNKCECGAEKANTTHSNWCPKY